MNPIRSRRIVLAAGAAAALTGLAAGVHTGTSAQAGTAGVTTKSATDASAPVSPAKAARAAKAAKRAANKAATTSGSRIDGIRGTVSVWLAAGEGNLPALCVGPTDSSAPTCDRIGESFALIHDKTDNVVVGVVPAQTGQVDVSWDGSETAVSAPLGGAWRGMRVFGIDADELGQPTGEGGVAVYTQEAKAHYVNQRTFLPALQMRQFAADDTKTKIAPLYDAANNEALFNAVQGLGAWRVKDRTCVGTIGEMDDNGRFTIGEETGPDADLLFWPQYCSEALKGGVDSAWALGWNAPAVPGTRYSLFALPGTAKRASLETGENLRLISDGANKLTLVDLGAGDSQLVVGSKSKPHFHGPVGKIAAGPIWGLGVLRVVG